MGVDRHLAAKVFESAHEAADDLAAVEAVEVMRAEVAIVGLDMARFPSPAHRISWAGDDRDR